MSPVYIMAFLALGARLLGVLGVTEVGSWLEAARWATGISFVIMGLAHFTSIRHDVARLVPPSVARPLLVVAILGVWQLAGGIGILTAPARRVGAAALLLLLILKLPANIRIARKSLRSKGRMATSPTWRVPAQFLWMALVWWVGT